jgi:exopolysaccharide biosynthesis protein
MLIIDGKNHGHGKREWPVLSIEPHLGEHRGGAIRTGFSGSSVLVRDGRPIKQKRSFFSRRRCPRTGIGVNSCGMLVVVVTTSATLDQFSRIMSENGAVFAINVDGGGSTMFIENGETLWKSRRSAVPVILSW